MNSSLGSCPAVLPVGVGRGTGDQGSERALEQIDVCVISEQVNGPQHGNLPQLDDASVEGSEQRHHGIHVEVSGQPNGGYQQHCAPHCGGERLQRAASAEAEKQSAESSADKGGSDEPEEMLVLTLGALPHLVGSSAGSRERSAEKRCRVARSAPFRARVRLRRQTG